MRTRITAGLFALAAGLVGLAADAAGQDPKAKAGPAPAPKFLHGHDLRVRPGGERDWAKAAKVGVEVFQDDASGAVVAITEAGSLAAFPVPPGGMGTDKSAKWLTAHDLKVRRADEPDFTQKTQTVGVEVFRDGPSGRLFYLSQAKSLAVAAPPPAAGTSGGPKWRHGARAKVRAPGQAGFDKAAAFGLEVFTDENTKGLIYITDKGFIAAAPPPPADVKFDPARPADPRHRYGLDLQVRAADEANFTDKTKRVGVEVFEDANAGVLVYVTDAGHVATAPRPAGGVPDKAPDGKAAPWKSAMNLKARPGGKADFKDAATYGIEVYTDGRTGYLLLVSQTGSLAVVAK